MSWRRGTLQSKLHCDGEGCEEAREFNYYWPIQDALDIVREDGWCRGREQHAPQDFCPKCRDQNGG